jgi:DNA-binding transcriptional regulator LsrR (DeoR family)
MGMNRDQIANKLGVSPYIVSQILAEASARGRR